MTRDAYKKIENYMLSLMTDAAHDSLHVYRVLYMALDIAATEPDANTDVLITACLLHDIGRELQFKDKSLCHAEEGARMAYEWLISEGWEKEQAAHIRDCISSHRYRGDNPPETLEAKILFDADKLDCVGTMAVARSFFYMATAKYSSMYALDEDGHILTAPLENNNGFFQEYNYKLRNVFDRFHTARGKELAEERRISGERFYNDMLREVSQSHEVGPGLLEQALS